MNKDFESGMIVTMGFSGEKMAVIDGGYMSDDFVIVLRLNQVSGEYEKVKALPKLLETNPLETEKKV